MCVRPQNHVICRRNSAQHLNSNASILCHWMRIGKQGENGHFANVMGAEAGIGCFHPARETAIMQRTFRRCERIGRWHKTRPAQVRKRRDPRTPGAPLPTVAAQASKGEPPQPDSTAARICNKMSDDSQSARWHAIPKNKS